MSYPMPQDLALDLALATLFDAQVRRGHYTTVADARQAALRIMQGSNTATRDVAAEVETETALHDSMDFARLALSAVSGVGAWTYEVSSDRFYCDAGISALYGIDPLQGAAGIKRHDFLANVHPEDLLALRKTMAGGLLASGDLELEYRIVQPDGGIRWVLSRGHTYFNSDGEPVRRTGVGIDMTSQRLLEQQLRQSQKMEVVGQLTGGIAHDFNNLLAGISGSLEMLVTRLAQGRLSDVDKYIVTAQGAVKRAAALTHRLLAFSRRQTLDPQPTDVHKLVQGMTDLIQRTVGPSISLQTLSAPDLWPTLVDPSQLENALLNLCVNARDAMPEGGSIRIESGNLVMSGEEAKANEVDEGEYLFLSVTDTGTGMLPHIIAKAFDPFFTTKPIGQGTGLGLSMIYGFAKQSGGQVRIHSSVGQGTSMYVYLPRYLGEARSEQASRLASVGAAGAGEIILIVEDEPTLRVLLMDVLGDLGYTLIEASDSTAGLDMLNSDLRIDLLISDVGLPGGMNGRQMADAARERRPDLKTLFITGYAEGALVGNGGLGPGMEVLTKPFAIDTLASRVRAMVNSSTG
jgi:signal transduction histidine kinase/ActR/RegA family two-component response regulator